MNGDHRRFEVQSALAVSGALDDREFSELARHTQVCAECARRLEEMICAASWLDDARDRRSARHLVPAGMKARFAVRVSSDGERAFPAKKKRASRVAVSGLALACLAALLFTHRVRRADPSHEAPAQIAAGDRAPVAAPVLPVRPVPPKHQPTARFSASLSRHSSGPFASSSLRPLIPSPPGPFAAPSFRPPIPASLGASPVTPAAFHGFDPGQASRPSFIETTPISRDFSWNVDSPPCDDVGPRLLLGSLSQSGPAPRRVFCFNPRVASLTSLDLSHAAASNAPPPFNLRVFAVRFPPAAR